LAEAREQHAAALAAVQQTHTVRAPLWLAFCVSRHCPARSVLNRGAQLAVVLVVARDCRRSSAR
jgi:hypothetical protein